MAFTYRLEHQDGTPADPPMFRSASGVTWERRLPGERSRFSLIRERCRSIRVRRRTRARLASELKNCATRRGSRRQMQLCMRE